MPYDVGARRPFVDEDLDLLLRDAAGNPNRAIPYFMWAECAQQHPYEDTSARWAHIIDGSGAIVDDDTGGRLIVVLLAQASSKTRSRWAAKRAVGVQDDE